MSKFGWDIIEKLKDEISLMEITDSTTYATLQTKRRAIIYGTGSAPTPTGYPDGCIYLQYVA
jgi:hypothetical protein